jgi:hypothetical protein
VLNGDQEDDHVAEYTRFISVSSELSDAKKTDRAHAESHLMPCVNPSIS